MPIIKSAKKRMRQEAKRRARNRAYKTMLKTIRKQTLQVLQDPKTTKEVAQKALNEFKSQMDKAWSKGIYKRNKSSRLKSAMDKLYNSRFGTLETKTA